MNAQIDQILASASVKTEILTRPAQNGDVITFDYTVDVQNFTLPENGVFSSGGVR